MKNQDLQQIRKRINERFSDRENADKVETQFDFENSIGLLEEQYLEIELGLKQLERGESINASDFLKKLKEI